jgi:outer membrane lipoprotein-sorting protein
MASSAAFLITTIIFIFGPMFSHAAAQIPLNVETLLSKMEIAYSGVIDYRVMVEVKTFKPDGSFEIQKFLYTFKKPKRTRLDFESPHPGMEMVYPDRNGKVVVRLPGLGHFLKLHLSPDNPLLGVASGQRIDQTDLGLLIENISHSLIDQRRGPVDITEGKGYVRIRVLAENHFRKGVVTLYHFSIDEALWLPGEVKESSPDGHLERTVTFQNLKTNIGISESYFKLDGG